MKSSYMSFDRRVRICTQCHTWFFSDGKHSRFCASCRSEAKHAFELPRLPSTEKIVARRQVPAEKEPVAG